MDKLDYGDYKMGLLALKYIPVIMFLIMWVHTGLSIVGVNGPFADTIAGSAIIPSILILTISIYQVASLCSIVQMTQICKFKEWRHIDRG